MAKERPVRVGKGSKMPLGSRIRATRQARRVRLSTMARDVGYNKGHLSNVENNRVRPSKELVEKVARYLDVSMQDLEKKPADQLAAIGGKAAPVSPPSLAHPALPVKFPVQKRTIGQRIERLIKAAHLTEEEEELAAEHLVALTRDVLSLVRSTRRTSRWESQ